MAAGTDELTLYLTPNLAELEGLEVIENRTVEKVSKVVLNTNGKPVPVLLRVPIRFRLR
ncbi:MAG: hypothetical protein R8M46_06155 [Ghiorsea sp.]